jgi:hypothetical protein
MEDGVMSINKWMMDGGGFVEIGYWVTLGTE